MSGQKTHPDKHREAIVKAINEDGMTAPEACHCAKVGRLIPDDRFDIPVTTARDWAIQARLNDQPDLQATVAKAKAVAQHDVELCLERQREGQNVGRELRDALGAVKAVYQAEAEARGKTPKTTEPTQENTPTDQGLEQRIIEEKQRRDTNDTEGGTGVS